MANTTYTVHADDESLQTTNPNHAEQWSRQGFRVTAVTHA